MSENENIGLKEAAKLTDWAKEPTVMGLKEDLDAAKPAHDAHVLNVKRWNDLRNVTGAARPKTLKNRSKVQPKLIRRQAEWRYSALSEPFLSSEKFFKVEPVTFEDGPAARQNQLLLNHQFRNKLNSVKFIDEYVRTGVDEGSIVVRIGWQRETRMVPVQLPIFEYVAIEEEADGQILQQAMEIKAENPRGFNELPEELKAAVDYFEETQTPTVATIVGYEEAEEEEILENKPTLDIVDSENCFIDPSCQGDIEKANFVIISYETSKAELIKDGRYKNLDVVNWSGNTILAQPDHKTEAPTDFNFKDDLRKRVVAYEYWGYHNVDDSDELKPIVATWIGDIMVRMEENPFPDEKPPFIVVPYLPVRRNLMGEPDAEILEDNQAILGAVMRGMIDLMGRSANAQQGMAKGFLDVTNRRRFERGEDYEFNPGTTPQMSVHQHTYPEIPGSAMTMINLQNQEAEALSGVKAFSGGLSAETYGDVAAGIKGMLDASSKREMNILRRLAKGIKDIGNKIIAMNAVFLSEEETIRVTNEEFVTIRREDLKGNFDLIVDISTAEVDEAKSQDLGFLLQTIGPDEDPEIRRLILSEIAELKRMPVLAQKIRTYQPQPDPFAEQVKQMEMEKLEAEIEEIRQSASLKRAQAAKAQAEADVSNLEYVEEETGTKHARDLQKQATQASSNQDLEVTKALLKERKPDTRAPDIAAAVGYNELSDPKRQVQNF